LKIFRNRTVIGVLCILLALIICFGVTPLFSRSASEKTEIVRVTKDIKEGDEITAEMIQTVEVGAYNLPQNLMTDKKEVVGKYATADLDGRRLHSFQQAFSCSCGRECLSL
jgi:SAF domain.